VITAPPKAVPRPVYRASSAAASKREPTVMLYRTPTRGADRRDIVPLKIWRKFVPEEKFSAGRVCNAVHPVKIWLHTVAALKS